VATASSSCSRVQSGAWANTSPVAGFTTSMSAAPAALRPLIVIA
jgi:hypothetical protein